MATTLRGGIIEALQASTTLFGAAGVPGLIPPGQMFFDEIVQEDLLPWLLLTSDPENPKWITKTCAFVKQAIHVQTFIEAATTAGAPNPGQAVLDAVRAALNLVDLNLDPTKVRIIAFLERSSSLKIEAKRSPADLRVMHGESIYDVSYERNT